MTSLDIIIVNYYSTDYLLNCLESVYQSLDGISANVSVVDNGSKDALKRIHGYFPRVHVDINSINIGFAAAANKIMRKSHSPYVVLLNPDTCIVDGFFKSVLDYMEKQPDIGILGPKVLNHDGTTQESARSFPSPLTGLFGRTTLFSRLFPGNKITRQNLLTKDSDGISPMEVDWVSGACMVLNRKALGDVGLMDERFFMYWEDADWCRRMWSNGWKVIYFPRPKMIHYVGGSRKQHPIKTIFDFHKSSFFLFAKYARWPVRLLIPMAIMALTIRFIIVIFIHVLKSNTRE